MLATLAGFCRREGDQEAAVRYYERALALEYGQVGWRMARAQSLVALGRREEAEHELRVVLRLRPKDHAAERLLAELIVAGGREYHEKAEERVSD